MGELLVIDQPIEVLGVIVVAVHGEACGIADLLRRTNAFAELTVDPALYARNPGAKIAQQELPTSKVPLASLHPRQVAQLLDEQIKSQALSGLPPSPDFFQEQRFVHSLQVSAPPTEPVWRIVANGRGKGGHLTKHQDFIGALNITMTNMLHDATHPEIMLCRGAGSAGHGFTVKRKPG